MTNAQQPSIQHLLQTLCPNGVPYATLGEVCSIATGDQLNKEQLLTDDSLYPVMNGGIYPSGYWKEYNTPANTIIISQGGASAGYTQFMETPFWAGAHCFKVSLLHEDLNLKYLYHFIKNNQEKLISTQQGAGIPSMSKKVFYSLPIPLPPLPIQERIVEILDKFSRLSAELEAELELRKKQYDFYRNRLLSFDSNSDTVQWMPLGEVCRYAKERIASDLVNAQNYVSVENLLPNKLGVTVALSVPQSGNCIKYQPNDILIGNIRPYLQKIWIADRIGGTNGDVLTLHIVDEYQEQIIPRYLYQVLSSNAFFDYDNQHSKGAKMPRGDKKAVLKYPIPLPPLPVQERIVGILDKFETLVSDLSQGLPAEINLVQKQYEYYRNQLLTF